MLLLAASAGLFYANSFVHRYSWGETLRGMLLKTYAFDTMAAIAKIAGVVLLIGGILLLILAALGFYLASRVKISKKRR